MKAKPVIRYGDELHDDFSDTNGRIRTVTVGSDYPYLHKSPVWHVLAFLLYRVIATPYAFLFCKIRFGLRIKNRAALRGLKGGFFLYGNHTQGAADAFIPSLLTFPRRCCIIAGPDAVSIPFVRHLVPMVGGIPLASTPSGKRKFWEALSHHIAAGHAVAIYPEAHIWPYYNRIRPYPDWSFTYPVKMGAPAVGFVVTYRQRRIFQKGPPLITVTVSEPVLPDARPTKAEIHGVIHRFMADTAESERSFAYLRYEKKTGEEAAAR